MKTSPVLLFGAAALLTSLVGVTQGCSSATQTIDGQGGTGSATAGTGGTGAAPAPTTGSGGTGSTTLGGAINCDPPNPNPICEGQNQDANCNTTNASTGAACMQNCAVECGFAGIGLKVCSCQNGTYESCPCPRPAAYKGELTAGFCETTDGSGLTDMLKNQPCTDEWSQCIGKDDTGGGTPRGCACINNPTTNALQWYCGSTNNWFSLVQEGQVLNACTMNPPADTCEGVNTDASCNSTNAKTGAACTKDCQLGCGFLKLGLKYCTCLNGAYTQCPCPKPDSYMGAPTAPLCPGDGLTTNLDDMPCTTEWEQCIGTDAVTGSTPRGCACLKDPVSNTLNWICGSTNKWFAQQ